LETLSLLNFVNQLGNKKKKSQRSDWQQEPKQKVQQLGTDFPIPFVSSKHQYRHA